MAQLYYRYSTMNAGKSIELIKVAYNYEERGKNVLTLVPAIDDRYGCFLGVELLKALKDVELDVDLYVGVSVQEEVGLRGARTSTYKVKPDIAIAIDVSMSYDVPGSSKGESKLGKGVALSLMDSSVIAHRGLFKLLKDICKEKNIPFTHDSLVAGGTDSGEINKSFDGVINMTLSLPCRYFHSHNSVVNLKDYNACIDLLTEFVTRLDKDVLEELKNYKK